MKTLKSKLIAGLSALVCLAVTCIIVQQPPVLWWMWATGLPAAAIVAITALVRGNEIPVEVDSWRSHIRRAGLFFANIGAISFMISPLKGFWPGWCAWFMIWGVAATWVTTPNMPPWWDYISGKKHLRKVDIV